MTVGLCLITWNELEGCKHDVPLIDRSQFDQVYCIDGGSTDGTVEYLQEQGIEVYRQTAKGLNQACKDGANFCKCDAFVFFHPKGSIPVEDTYKFRELYEQGYEFIVGSRMMKESHNEEDDKLLKPRKWFVLGLGLAAYPSLNPYTGSMPGIKAFVAAVFGGIGSIPGAFIGGVLLGIIEIFAKAYISSQVADAIVFAVLIIVLLIKPTGILGKNIQEKV